MKPDCQLLTKKSLFELDYFSVYKPIKKTELNKTELKTLTTHAKFMVNENLLTSHVAILFLDAIKKIVVDNEETKVKLINDFNNYFIRLVKISGYSVSLTKLTADSSTSQIFTSMQEICEDIYHNCMNFCNGQLSFDNEAPTIKYTGALTNYLNFLHPLILNLKK